MSWSSIAELAKAKSANSSQSSGSDKSSKKTITAHLTEAEFTRSFAESLALSGTEISSEKEYKDLLSHLLLPKAEMKKLGDADQQHMGKFWQVLSAQNIGRDDLRAALGLKGYKFLASRKAGQKAERDTWTKQGGSKPQEQKAASSTKAPSAGAAVGLSTEKRELSEKEVVTALAHALMLFLTGKVPENQRTVVKEVLKLSEAAMPIWQGMLDLSISLLKKFKIPKAEAFDMFALKWVNCYRPSEFAWIRKNSTANRGKEVPSIDLEELIKALAEVPVESPLESAKTAKGLELDTESKVTKDAVKRESLTSPVARGAAAFERLKGKEDEDHLEGVPDDD